MKGSSTVFALDDAPMARAVLHMLFLKNKGTTSCVLNLWNQQGVSLAEIRDVLPTETMVHVNSWIANAHFQQLF